MRALLVDWMVQTHEKFRLLPETLFLSVNYLDRFLAAKPISVQKLQLAGVTSLMIASKFEEIHPPRLREWVYAVDGSFGSQEILKAEKFVLNMLQFETSVTEPYHVLRRLSRADGYQIGPRTLAKYLLEITLLDEEFLRWPTSQIASACMFLALKMISSRGEWTDAHVFYCGYEEAELLAPVHALMALLNRPGLDESRIYKKYASAQFMRGSLYVKDVMVKWQA